MLQRVIVSQIAKKTILSAGEIWSCTTPTQKSHTLTKENVNSGKGLLLEKTSKCFKRPRIAFSNSDGGHLPKLILAALEMHLSGLVLT